MEEDTTGAFCKGCGRMLKIASASENPIIICDCGFVNENKGLTVSQKMQKKEKVGKGVVRENKKKNLSGFPNTCKKCNHKYCEIFDMGVQYGDESGVILYKCKKCGFVERQADGPSNN